MTEPSTKHDTIVDAEEPTAYLRWSAQGSLQQQWGISYAHVHSFSLDDGKTWTYDYTSYSTAVEWRPIPAEVLPSAS